MLIVPHALHCVDICIFVFYLISLSLAYWFGFSGNLLTPLPAQKEKCFRFRFFVQIHLQETYFEMLIVQMLCIVVTFFYFTSFDSLTYCFVLSAPAPSRASKPQPRASKPHPPRIPKVRFRFLSKYTYYRAKN